MNTCINSALRKVILIQSSVMILCIFSSCSWYDRWFGPYEGPRFKTELNITRTGEITKIFRNEKEGKYNFGMDFNCPPQSCLYRTDLKIQIDFFLNKALVHSRVFEGSDFLIGTGPDRIFYAGRVYKSPGDLPLGTSITCQIKILKPDQKLYDCCPYPVVFYIYRDRSW